MVGRGRYLLMADADGATKFSDLEKLEAAMKRIEKDELGIVVGSRAHLEAEVVSKVRPFACSDLCFVSSDICHCSETC